MPSRPWVEARATASRSTFLRSAHLVRMCAPGPLHRRCGPLGGERAISPPHPPSPKSDARPPAGRGGQKRPPSGMPLPPTPRPIPGQRPSLPTWHIRLPPPSSSFPSPVPWPQPNGVGKSRIRISKYETNSNPNVSMKKTCTEEILTIADSLRITRFCHLNFCHLKLFRIWCFGFRM